MDEYETHLTVGLATTIDILLLQTWAGERGFKFTHIVLDRGHAASQPMLTSHGRGPLSEQLAVAEVTAGELAAVGFLVTRIKIEAAPWNADVPRTSSEARALSGNLYFEHHIKLLLGPDASTEQIRAVAQRHCAHLSRNALRRRDDGNHERFVSQRCYAVGRPEASQRLAKLIDEIRPLGHQILDVEEEFVVYDSNIGLDSGWIEPD